MNQDKRQLIGLVLLTIGFWFSILYMPLPFWGQLEKAQDDPQTLEQYIAEQISDHNDNSESHNGEGQSLKAHKSEPVLNHPAGSIVSDKRSANDLEWNFNFNSIDGFSQVGSVSSNNLKLRLYVEDGAVNLSSISASPMTQTALDNVEHSILLESTFFFENGGTNTAKISFSNMDFEIEDDRVRLVVQLTGMGSPVVSDWVSVDTTKVHTLRANFFVLESVVRFYVDGNLEDELSATFTPANDPYDFSVRHDRVTASDDYFYVSKVVLSLYEFQ